MVGAYSDNKFNSFLALIDATLGTSTSYNMGGNMGTGVGINFAVFRGISPVEYVFLVGYFTIYPATSPAIS